MTLKGVSLGAAYNDYADVTDGTFSVSHSTATVGVANGGLDGNWGFQVNAATDFPPNDNFSISLLEGGGANILTINLDYAGANLWALSVNGNALVGAGGAQGFVEAGGFYRLYANFGATTGFGVNVVALDGSIIQFNGTTADFSAKDFGRVAIGESNGLGGGSFGNSFITVVPEPSSAMLLSLIPGFFILRRRR
ncbi:MAG: PEP-CTERM sorting domain-containing protein [Luteolibacter sp.]